MPNLSTFLHSTIGRLFLLGLLLSLSLAVSQTGPVLAESLPQSGQPDQATSLATVPVSFDLPAVGREIKNVHYCRSYQSQQTLDVYAPDPSFIRPVPVVVYVHGGGWGSGDKNDAIMHFYKLSLLNKGMAVVSVGYRLAPAFTYPAQNQDISCALDFIYRQSDSMGVDRQRMALMGESAGGELVAFAALSQQDRSARWRQAIRGVVDLYGVSDFTSVVMSDHYDGAARQFLGPNYHRVAAEASPMYGRPQSPPPFLMYHGTADPVVPFGQSLALDRYLRTAGASSRLVAVPGAGHGFNDQSSIKDTVIRRQVTQFLDQVFQPPLPAIGRSPLHQL